MPKLVMALLHAGLDIPGVHTYGAQGDALSFVAPMEINAGPGLRLGLDLDPQETPTCRDS